MKLILLCSMMTLIASTRNHVLAFSSRSSTFTRSLTGVGRPYSTTRLTMKLQTAIVGLPNVGKSTLFNALTETQGAEAGNYPFCTIEPNVGVVSVPDAKLNVLSKINKSAKIVPATLEFVDVAGLIKGTIIARSDGDHLSTVMRNFALSKMDK